MPTGKVKWFNNNKGYGFILSDMSNEDLFAHYSSIQMEGYKTLKAGQTVNFDVQEADKGLHAVNIHVVDQKANAALAADASSQEKPAEEPKAEIKQTEEAAAG